MALPSQRRRRARPPCRRVATPRAASAWHDGRPRPRLHTVLRPAQSRDVAGGPCMLCTTTVVRIDKDRGSLWLWPAQSTSPSRCGRCTVAPRAREGATATDRWAVAVVQVVSATIDVATLDAWARAVHMSRRTLCHRCEAAHAAPKSSLDLGRLLRTLTLGPPHDWRPEDWLTPSDPRTVRRLLDTAGVRHYRGGPPPTVADLLRAAHRGVPEAARDALERRLRHELPWAIPR
jgi:hypothetical protein